MRSFQRPTRKCIPGQVGDGGGFQQEGGQVTLWLGRGLLEARWWVG